MRNEHYRGSRDWNRNRPDKYNRHGDEHRQWNYYNNERDGYYDDPQRWHHYSEFSSRLPNRDEDHWMEDANYYRDERNMGNFVERTGERLRDAWNHWTHPHERRHEWKAGGYYHQENRDRRHPPEYSRDHRDEGFFERAGDRIRETWNDWTHRRNDDDRDYINNSYRYHPEDHHRFRLTPMEHFPYDRNEKNYGDNNWEYNGNRGGNGRYRERRNRRQYYSW